MQECIDAVLTKDEPQVPDSEVFPQVPSPRKRRQAAVGVAALVSKVNQKRKKKQSKKVSG